MNERKTQEKFIKSVLEEQLENLLTDIITINEEWLTPSELEERTGWSRPTINDLRNQGLIPCFRHGRKVLYPWRQIEREFLREHMV